MVVPSRQEAFGQTASEALACGCPVAAFDATGLKDVVEHRVSGYLAKPFDVRDLALGIEWLLQEQNRLESPSSLRLGVSANTPLRTAARQRAVDLFSYPVISQQYLKVYQQVIDAKR
jgi:glycosyltransferase involved in cell wall biosynthesis